MRRLWIIVAACIVLAACGDDGGDSGGDGSGQSESAQDAPQQGSDEFCMTLEPLTEIDPVAEPTDDEIMLLEEAKAAAPDDLQYAFDELIAVTELFVQPDLELDDLAQFDEETQRQASADLVAAAEDCGLDVPIFVYGDDGDGGGDAGVGGDAAAARERYEASDMRAAIEASDPSLEGQVGLIARANDDITVQIAASAAGQAEAVCEVVDEYLEEIGYPQAEARVTDAADTTLATRESGGGCTPAG